MKTILLNVMFCLLFFNPAFSAKPIVHVNAVEGKPALIVQVANLEKARTEVLLKDMDGRLEYSGHISGRNGHSLKLNLEGLAEGAYLLGVSNRNFREVKAFIIAGGQIRFFESQGAGTDVDGLGRNASQPLSNRGRGDVIANIRTAGGEGLLNVQLSNLRSKPVHTRITSLSGLNWHQEVETARNGFSRNYITKGMPDGAYYLFVEAGQTRIVQFFEIDKGHVVLGSIQRAEVPADMKS